MEHLINEISEKLKAKNILNHVTIGAALTNNIESGCDFYRLICEFSNGEANGLCRFYNEVNFLIEAYIYINGKKIFTINYENSSIINWSQGENEHTKKKPKVTMVVDNLSEPKFRQLTVDMDLSDIEKAPINESE